jgi:histone acetyltransferase (RNA polymerase elongator complex component)
VIVPVFLPHLGCRQKCIYCNQHQITGQKSREDTEEVIRKALDPVKAPAEVAIYGGNPFGLGTHGLTRLFSLFSSSREKITSMRLSTEPIKPDPHMIDLLKDYNVRTIELGIPVFSDEKLRALGRHHSVKDLHETFDLLSQAGFMVGLQVMVGLPGETAEEIRSCVRHLLRLKPAFVRIYPLVVLRDTPLCTAFEEKCFIPLSLEEAVLRALFIYLHAEAHGVKVIKMGLTENEFIKSEIVAGPFHPAFGYLVRSEAFYLAITSVCKERGLSGQMGILLNKRDVPHLIGHRRSNLKRLAEQGIQVEWKESDLPPGDFQIHAIQATPNTNFHSRRDRGGSEEPHPRAGTRAYVEVRRGERRSDNEGIYVKGNWYKDAIPMLPF